MTYIIPMTATPIMRAPNPVKRLTAKLRLSIYKHALLFLQKQYINDPNAINCVCAAISAACIEFNYTYMHSRGDIVKFVEFYKHKPSRAGYNNFWFENTPDRISALEQCIKEVELKIKNRATKN